MEGREDTEGRETPKGRPNAARFCWMYLRDLCGSILRGSRPEPRCAGPVQAASRRPRHAAGLWNPRVLRPHSPWRRLHCRVGYLFLTFSLPLLNGTGSGDALSTSMVSGDLDGDGRIELVVAAPGDDTAGTDAGAIFVFEADEFSLDPTPTQVLTGTTGDELGATLDLGDLDGDGFLDLLVGAPNAGMSGEVHVYGALQPASRRHLPLQSPRPRRSPATASALP